MSVQNEQYFSHLKLLTNETVYTTNERKYYQFSNAIPKPKQKMKDYKDGKKFKYDINEWLKNMTIDTLEEVFSLTNNYIILKIVFFYQKKFMQMDKIDDKQQQNLKLNLSAINQVPSLLDEPSGYKREFQNPKEKQKQQCYEVNNPNKYVFKKLIQAVKIIDIITLCDTLILDRWILKEIHELINILDTISDNKIFEQIPTLNGPTSIWCKEPIDVCMLIVQELEKSIIFRFQEEHKMKQSPERVIKLLNISEVNEFWQKRKVQSIGTLIAKTIKDFEDIKIIIQKLEKPMKINCSEEQTDGQKQNKEQKKKQLNLTQDDGVHISKLSDSQNKENEIISDILIVRAYKKHFENFHQPNEQMFKNEITETSQDKNFIKNLFYNSLGEIGTQQYFLKKILLKYIIDEFKADLANSLTSEKVSDKSTKKKKNKKNINKQDKQDIDEKQQELESQTMMKECVEKVLSQLIDQTSIPIITKEEQCQSEQIVTSSSQKKRKSKTKSTKSTQSQAQPPVITDVSQFKCEEEKPIKILSPEHSKTTPQQLDQFIQMPHSTDSTISRNSQSSGEGEKLENNEDSEWFTTKGKSEKRVSNKKKQQNNVKNTSYVNKTTQTQCKTNSVQNKNNQKQNNFKSDKVKNSSKLLEEMPVQKAGQNNIFKINEENLKSTLIQTLDPKIKQDELKPNKQKQQDLQKLKKVDQLGIQRDNSHLKIGSKNNSSRNLDIPKQLSYNLPLPKRLTNELQYFYSKICEENQFCKKAKNQVINLVYETVNQELRTIIYVFGSMSTGLQLVDSDIDIAITGYELCQKQDHIDFLKRLDKIFTNKVWVTSSKLIYFLILYIQRPILTASIPVLKLEISVSNLDQCYKNNKLSQKFQVDLTFQTQDIGQHLGPHSTQIVINWCSQLPHFVLINIFVKYLLRKRKFNDSYTGGLSSFCLSIMIAALYYNTTQPDEVGQILLNFLDKYGNNFNPQNEGVKINENGFIQLDQNSLNPPLTVYSPLTCTVISFGATKINNILEEFKKILTYLKEQNESINLNSNLLLKYFED